MAIRVIFEDRKRIDDWLAKYSATLIRETYIGDGVSLAHVNDAPFAHDVWVDKGGAEFYVKVSPLMKDSSQIAKGDPIKAVRNNQY